MFDAIVSIFLALIFGRALLFHFCTHEGSSQTLSCGHSGVLLNFGDKLSSEDLPTQCKHAKAFFSFKLQTYLFWLRAVRTVPESTEKCVQSSEASVQFGPVRAKMCVFLKRTFFSHVHPSIRQNCFSSWHHKIRASGCAQTPCIFCISVAMCKCLPPQLIVKSRRMFYMWIQSCSAKKF